MSEESTTPDLVELTRLGFAAFNRGDLGAYTSPDIVLDTVGYGMGTFELDRNSATRPSRPGRRVPLTQLGSWA